MGFQPTSFASYLVEVVERLVQIGVHASGRFIGDFDGVFQDALWDDVALWGRGGFGTNKHPEILVAPLGVLLQEFLQRAQPASHQVDVLQDHKAPAGREEDKVFQNQQWNRQLSLINQRLKILERSLK